MIQPHEIQIGSMIECKSSDQWAVKIVDIFDLIFIDSQLEDFNDCHRPIPLTEDILVKWCGFEKVKNKVDIFEKGRIRLALGARGQTLAYLIEEDTINCHYINSYEYLHQIQILYMAHKNTPLKITLK
jgi:hypothetical protein